METGNKYLGRRLLRPEDFDAARSKMLEAVRSRDLKIIKIYLSRYSRDLVQVATLVRYCV